MSDMGGELTEKNDKCGKGKEEELLVAGKI
jgi:hypothetical protein